MCGEEVGWGGGVGWGEFGELDALFGGVEGTVFPDGLISRVFMGCFDEFVVLFVVMELEGS